MPTVRRYASLIGTETVLGPIVKNAIKKGDGTYANLLKIWTICPECGPWLLTSEISEEDGIPTKHTTYTRPCRLHGGGSLFQRVLGAPLSLLEKLPADWVNYELELYYERNKDTSI